MSAYGDLLDAEEQRVKQADGVAIAATGSAPAPANPYAQVLDQEAAGQRTLLKASLRTAAGGNPDDAGEARRLRKRYPAPDDVLLRNLQDAKLQEAVDIADEHLLTSPKLADRMLDIRFARVAVDDVPTLAELEARIAQFGELRNSTGPQPTLGSVLTGLGKALPQGAELARQGMRLQVADLLGDEGVAAGAQRRFAAAQTDVALSTPDFESATASGIYGGGTSLLRQIPGLVASIATRSSVPALAAAGVQTQTEAYGKYRARGAEPFPALAGSVGEGAVEIGTEALPMGFLVKQFGRAGAGQFLKGLLGREVPGEQVATLLQDAIDTAIANPDKTWQQYLEERPGAAYQTLLATIVQSGAIGGLHSAAKSMADRQQRAEAAQAQGEALARVMEMAAQSHLRERDPEALATFVQHAADADRNDGTPSLVYVDGLAFAQSLATLPQAEQEKLAAAMPRTIEALAEAADTAGDVAIPLGELTALAGTPLEQTITPLVRTDPDAWTPAEADEFGKQQGELLQREAEQVFAQSQVHAEVEQQVAGVRDELLGQLRKANRFTEDVNTAYAALAADFYTVMAGRLGVAPAELWQRFPLRIVAESVAGKGLDQSGRLRPSPVLNSPRTPTSQEMEQHARVEDVALDKAFSTQATRQWDRFDSGDHPPPMVEGYGAKPVAVKLRGGEYLILDGHHRAERALEAGDRSMSMHVIDAADYDPQNAGRKSSQGGPSDDDILRGLLEQSARGAFDPGSNTIALLKAADLSTFLHEMGHFHLEALAHIAAGPGAPAPVLADMQVLLDWFGHKGTPAEWLAQPIDVRRDAHERFARGFEAYLFEGKAPSVELTGLFQRFRAWMVQVYKSLAALNVELTEEVRGVMNRLLATDQQIADAQEAAGQAPLFDSAQAADMTPEQFAAYQALGADATADAIERLQRESLRDMRWLSNAKGKKLRELQKDAAAKRKTMETQVTTEVDAQPIEQARAYLKELAKTDPETKAAIKAWEGQRDDERERLRAVVKAELVAANPNTKGLAKGQMLAKNKRQLEHEVEGLMLQWERNNPKPIRAKNDVELDLVATLFGFSSGDHLARELAEAPPRQELIEGMTDQRMLETYGDLTSPQAIERAAEAAIHNEARGRFVAAELKALERATGGVNLLVRQAKAFVKGALAAKRIRDIRPGQYRAAEARAGRATGDALKKGDTAGAAAAKRNQLVNHYGAREAADALTEVDKAVAYLTGINTKALDPEYVEQIDAILERFDLRTGQSLKAIDKRKSLAEWVESQRAMGFEPTVDAATIDAAQRTHYRDLPLEQFRGMVDTVRNIEHLGRLKKKLLTAKDAREFAAAVADAEASIRGNARKTRSQKYGDAGGVIGEAFRGVLAMHRKFASMVREMDGFADGGALWELFVRPMNDAGNREAAMREQATVDLAKVFEPMLKQKLTRKEFIPEINDSLTREQQLAIALNWGNEANRARVMQGDGWSEAQVLAILNRLTKPEWDFVQSVWDHVDSYWPAIRDKEKRLTGSAPEKVEAVEVVTPHGTYRGGYYPIKYDPDKSSKAEADTAAEVAKQMMGGAYTRATTRRGHTKARVEEVAGRPVRKDFGVVFEHVNQVAHDVAWHEWLIDAQRLLRAKPIDAAIREHYGPEVLREMRKAIEDMAAGDVPAQDHLERAMNHLRVGTTIAGLGWNLMTSLLQPIGLTQSIVRIGPKWVAKGMVGWLGDAAKFENTAAQINAKSDFMRLRAKTQQRELNEILNVVKGKKLTKVEATYFWMIQAAQRVADIPTWLGGYEKALAEGNDESRSIALADQAVLDAQGGGQIKDLARVQRGGVWMKLWTNFYSFFNVLHNLSAESFNRTDFKKPEDIARLAMDYLLLYALPAALVTMLRHAILGDDDDDLVKKLAADQLTYLTGTMLGVREVSAGIQGAMGLYSDYNGPAGARFFNEIAKLGKQAGQGDADAAFLKALNNAAGILLHYPAGQVQRTVAGFEALRDGDTRNPLALLTGPPKK